MNLNNDVHRSYTRQPEMKKRFFYLSLSLIHAWTDDREQKASDESIDAWGGGGGGVRVLAVGS